MTMPTPIPVTNFSFPGVLNSKQLLVAEAVQARAWAALEEEIRLGLETEAEARDRLGRIVVKLIGDRYASVTDLAAAAVEAFRAARPTVPQRR